MTTLNVIIVTCGPDGVGRAAGVLQQPVEGVSYVVSWQNSGETPVPDAMLRPDVTVLRHCGVGSSSNRNNALMHCLADVVLFADDDITYTEDAFKRVISIFDADKELVIATFKADIPGKGGYPERATVLGKRMPKDYSVSAIEIACRRKALDGLRFCNDLGAGLPLAAGEDEFFLKSAIRRGLECCYFPIQICSHPAISTGQSRCPDAAILRGQGCTIALLYPLTAMARIPLKALRLCRSGRSGFVRALKHLMAGALAAPGVYYRFINQIKTDNR